MTAIIVLLVLVAIVFALALVRRYRRAEGIVAWQFGRFTNTRPGIQGHPVWSDEADVVEYDDYRYWVRLRPNPGINLPVVGYWSKANGRTRR